MKITAIAIVAAATIALFTASPAVAADSAANPTHANLAHRSVDRQQTYNAARRLGLSHSQTDRLKSNLKHEARDDKQAHRTGSAIAPSYQSYAPSYGSTRQPHATQSQYRAQPRYQSYAAPHSRYSNQRVQTIAPTHRNYVPSYNTHALNISTPSFSLRIGH